MDPFFERDMKTLLPKASLCEVDILVVCELPDGETNLIRHLNIPDTPFIIAARTNRQIGFHPAESNIFSIPSMPFFCLVMRLESFCSHIFQSA